MYVCMHVYIYIYIQYLLPDGTAKNYVSGRGLLEESDQVFVCFNIHRLHLFYKHSDISRCRGEHQHLERMAHRFIPQGLQLKWGNQLRSSAGMHCGAVGVTPRTLEFKEWNCWEA